MCHNRHFKIYNLTTLCMHAVGSAVECKYACVRACVRACVGMCSYFSKTVFCLMKHNGTPSKETQNNYYVNDVIIWRDSEIYIKTLFPHYICKANSVFLLVQILFQPDAPDLMSSVVHTVKYASAQAFDRSRTKSTTALGETQTIAASIKLPFFTLPSTKRQDIKVLLRSL